MYCRWSTPLAVATTPAAFMSCTSASYVYASPRTLVSRPPARPSGVARPSEQTRLDEDRLGCGRVPLLATEGGEDVGMVALEHAQHLVAGAAYADDLVDETRLHERVYRVGDRLRRVTARRHERGRA